MRAVNSSLVTCPRSAPASVSLRRCGSSIGPLADPRTSSGPLSPARASPCACSRRAASHLASIALPAPLRQPDASIMPMRRMTARRKDHLRLEGPSIGSAGYAFHVLSEVVAMAGSARDDHQSERRPACGAREVDAEGEFLAPTIASQPLGPGGGSIESHRHLSDLPPVEVVDPQVARLLSRQSEAHRMPTDYRIRPGGKDALRDARVDAHRARGDADARGLPFDGRVG